MVIGNIVSISDINVKIYINQENKLKIGDILETNLRDKKIKLEVVEINNLIATTVPFSSVIGLKKGSEVYYNDKGLVIEYSDNILGRVFNSYGDVIDNSSFESLNTRNVYASNLNLKDISINSEIMWTGIKVIDFFSPIARGFKMGLLGGAGVGKTVLIKELINNIYKSLS
mgnify:FL=1